MEKKWTYRAVCSIIQMHFVRGMWEGKFSAEDIYASPGSDANLVCQTRTEGFLVQMQWSKVAKESELIALYHPQHGFYCASGAPCTSLVTFTESPGGASHWTLHLRNVSSSLSGKYECSFILFPEGIQTKIYNLLIQKNVTKDEWISNNTIETEVNQTLEIPCFQSISSEISPEFTLAWLVEDNGTQETLITQGHPISNSSLFKDRVKLSTDYGLYLAPVQIHDDGRKFSCHVIVKPGKSLRSSTTVKVFAKPEIPIIVENNSMDVLGKKTFTCSLRNVFPTANLTWFIERSFPQGEREEIYVTNEERKDKRGFSNVKSVFTRAYDNKSALSNNLTIWCMALSPLPGNKVWNISSEKITFSLDSVSPPEDRVLSVTEATLATQPSPAHSRSPTTSWMPNATQSSPPSDAGSTRHGIVLHKPKDGTSWPVMVAALLFFCLVLFGLGVRKWWQYQQEIMERPPPFKPPPPPIKYTCIQESIGSDLPCHELETL